MCIGWNDAVMMNVSTLLALQALTSLCAKLGYYATALRHLSSREPFALYVYVCNPAYRSCSSSSEQLPQLSGAGDWPGLRRRSVQSPPRHAQGVIGIEQS